MEDVCENKTEVIYTPSPYMKHNDNTYNDSTYNALPTMTILITLNMDDITYNDTTCNRFYL